MPTEENLKKNETKPEAYLREIRDLQLQNNELLKMLAKSEEKKNRRHTIKMVGSIFLALLPYIFSLFVAWVFYAKVQESVGSLKTFITDIPSAVTQMFKGDLEEKKNNILETGENWKEKGAEYWNNL